MALSTTNQNSSLATIFDTVKRVFFHNKPLTLAATTAGTGETLLKELTAVTTEFPVLENGVTFDTGDTETSEVNLTDGSIWTSKSTKGDSDIQFQVASVNDTIASLFVSQKIAAISGVNTSLGGASTAVAFAGKGYALDVKKTTGSIIMFDQSGETMIVLPNIEMFGALKQDGDNPAYFNVKVSPKQNSEGVALAILTKTA